MLAFISKRLLLLLPTLWLISSVIFLLSKLLPGQAGTQQFDRDIESAYGEVGHAARLQAYRQYLHRTGQDLPLFYISLRSRSEPDTLHRIFPASDQYHLQQLTLRYGHWPSVAAFYRQAQDFQRQVYALPPAEGKLALAGEVELLLLYAEAGTAAARLASLRAQVETHYPAVGLTQKVESVIDAHRQMQQSAHGAAVQFPVIQWNGLQNQYHWWFSSLLQGSLGTSYRDERQVTELLGEALGNTFWLMLGSLVVAVGLAIEISVLLNRQKYRRWGKPVLGLLYILDSIPLFLIALALLLLFSGLGILPSFPLGGIGSYGQEVSGAGAFALRLYYLALPLLCFALARLPYVTGQTYRALEATMSAPFITTARAKGLPESGVLRRHALRNALLPVITLMADFLPSLVAGALVIEIVFAIPGVGRLLTDSVLARDYPVIMGIVLLMALVKILAYILTDIVYYLADPRIKLPA